jgi:hypothetical protein
MLTWRTDELISEEVEKEMRGDNTDLMIESHVQVGAKKKANLLKYILAFKSLIGHLTQTNIPKKRVSETKMREPAPGAIPLSKEEELARIAKSAFYMPRKEQDMRSPGSDGWRKLGRGSCCGLGVANADQLRDTKRSCH